MIAPFCSLCIFALGTWDRYKENHDSTKLQFDAWLQTSGLANLLSKGSIKTVSLFSSVSATLGNIGQTNYAAANAAMEAMAEGYQMQGINISAEGWGPWAVAGMAAQPSLLLKLKQQGDRTHIKLLSIKSVLALALERQWSDSVSPSVFDVSSCPQAHF